MKININGFVALSLVFIFFACAKDKGNYDYSEVNRVIVTTTDSVFTIQQLKELSITPTLTETVKGASDNYTYAWTVYPTSTVASNSDVGSKEPDAILLSSDQNFKEIINLAPNDYYLQYTITNQANGIKTIKRFLVKVTGAFYEGWIVMSNEQEKAKLSFIRKDNELFRNVVLSSNGFDLKGKGLRAYSGVITMMSEIFVFTDQEAYRFNADGFKLSANEDKMFSQKINFTNPYYTVNHINTDQYIIDGGKIYGTISQNFGCPGKYSTPFTGLDYSAASYFFSGDKYYVTFYDNKNKRFVFADYNSRVLHPFNAIAGSAYDLRNVGKTLVAADRGMNKEYYLIMKDDEGFYYYRYNPSISIPADLYQKMNTSPDIEKAKAFAASGVLQHMYYAADNKIYLYDIMANSSRLVYTFPSNKRIKDMQMYKGKGWGKFTDPLFNKRIVVATNDDTQGEVYYFDLAPTGDIEGNTYVKVFGGFGDIVQLNYRNPNE